MSGACSHDKLKFCPPCESPLPTSPVRGARWGAGRGGGEGWVFLPGFSPERFLCAASGRSGDKMSAGVWDSPSNSGAPGRGGEVGGKRRREAGGNYSCLRANKMYSCIRGDSLPNSHKQKNTCAHAHRRAQRHAKHALGRSQSNESSQLGSPSPGPAVFLQSERPC